MGNGRYGGASMQTLVRPTHPPKRPAERALPSLHSPIPRQIGNLE